MKTWLFIPLLFFLYACRLGSSSESGQTLAERFCVSDDAFSSGALKTVFADKIEINLPFGALNQLHQELGLPMQLNAEMDHEVYMMDFLGMLNQQSCFCTILVDVEFNGRQKELVLMSVAGNTLTPVAILAGDYSFAECTIELSSAFIDKNIEVVKQRTCMGEEEEPVILNLSGKLK